MKVTLKNGDHRELVMSDMDNSINLAMLKGYVESRFNYVGAADDVSEVFILNSDEKVRTIDLDAFTRIDLIKFERVDLEFNTIYLPKNTKYKVIGVPEHIYELHCGRYATITNFKRLLKNGVHISMR